MCVRSYLCVSGSRVYREKVQVCQGDYKCVCQRRVTSVCLGVRCVLGEVLRVCWGN